MNSNFDPYREWLGIPKAEQPPNYYRLLGIQLLESDPSIVDRAADRAMLYLKTLSAGEYGQIAARLMSEVSLARVSLLDPARKAGYDASLMAAAAPPAPVRVAVQAELRPPPLSSTTIEAVTSHPRPLAATPMRAGRKPNQPQKLASSILVIVQIVFGGAGGLAIATLFVWISFGKDPLGLFNRSGNTSPSKAVTQSGHLAPATPKKTAELPVVRHRKPAASKGIVDEPGKSAAPVSIATSTPAMSPRAANDLSPKAGMPEVSAGKTEPPHAPLVESVFHQVPPACALPPLDGPAHYHHLLTLGRASEEPLLLSVLDEAADLPENGRLLAVPMAGNDSEWQVGYVVEDDRSANRKLATIRRDGARLLWSWEAPANALEFSHQLANCQVQLTTGMEQRTIQLREPIELPQLTLDFYDDAQSIELPIEHLPRRSSLRLEVVGLSRFSGGPELRNGVKSALIGKQITIDFRDPSQAELGLRFFFRSSSGKIVLQANPVFVESSSRKYELTFSRLEAAKESFEKAVQETHNEIQTVRTELSNWQSQLQTLQANPPSGAAAKAVWDPQVGKAAGEIRRLSTRLSSLDKKLSPLSIRLQGVPALRDFMNSLHEIAAIQYMVVAECGERDLVLVDARGSTPEVQ